MAKHRRSKKIRMGSLAAGGIMGDVVPSAAGLGTALLSTLALRSFITPDSAMKQNVVRYAPLIGGGLGLLAAGAIGYFGGMSKATAAGVSSVLGGGLLFASERLNASSPAIDAALAPSSAPGTTAGMRALTAEIRNPGLNGVVMEPLRGDFGETVNAGGGLRGSFNPSAFGRPQSAVG